MSKHLNRPVVGLDEDGQRYFQPLPKLLSRVELKIFVYDHQLAAHLVSWEPGLQPQGHLVWQHHVDGRHKQHTARHDAVGALGHTADWLEGEGWPGVVF